MTGARTEGCSYLTAGWEQGFESFKAREKVLVKKYKIMSLLTLMGVLSRNILHHLCSFLHSGPVLCSWLSRQTHPGSSGTQPSHRPGAASGSAGLSAWSWWWWWSCGCWRSPCTKTGRLRLNNFLAWVKNCSFVDKYLLSLLFSILIPWEYFSIILGKHSDC